MRCWRSARAGGAFAITITEGRLNHFTHAELRSVLPRPPEDSAEAASSWLKQVTEKPTRPQEGDKPEAVAAMLFNEILSRAGAGDKGAARVRVACTTSPSSLLQGQEGTLRRARVHASPLGELHSDPPRAAARTQNLVGYGAPQPAIDVTLLLLYVRLSSRHAVSRALCVSGTLDRKDLTSAMRGLGFESSLVQRLVSQVGWCGVMLSSCWRNELAVVVTKEGRGSIRLKQASLLLARRASRAGRMCADFSRRTSSTTVLVDKCCHPSSRRVMLSQIQIKGEVHCLVDRRWQVQVGAGNPLPSLTR